MTEEDRISRKHKFVRAFNALNKDEIRHIVLAIRLPAGAIEVSVNSKNILEKIQHIIITYDKDLRMYDNQQIQIVDYMIL